MEFQVTIDQLISQNFLNPFISHWGLTELKTPLTIENYKNWIKDGFNGEMDYLAKHSLIKEFPEKHYTEFDKCLVFAIPYFPHPKKIADHSFSHLKTSLYSQGEDYHHWIPNLLSPLVNDLKEISPESQFLICTDSSPLLERDLAYRAGLGWFGKNTCLIHPKNGSLFFIAEILTNMKIPLTEIPLVHDFCGKCTRCIDVCPTQALSRVEKKLDANKCLSYWNIEAKSVIPEDLRAQMQDWFFGCDLCQTVCPWNQKKLKLYPETKISRDIMISQLKEIILSSNKLLQKKTQLLSLNRTSGSSLKRNALIVIGNLKLTELQQEVELLKNKNDPKLVALCDWTLRQLKEFSL